MVANEDEQKLVDRIKAMRDGGLSYGIAVQPNAERIKGKRDGSLPAD
jgi:uncharacterized protein YoaH (UPF0181 family)